VLGGADVRDVVLCRRIGTNDDGIFQEDIGVQSVVWEGRRQDGVLK
jgi:hypothetical protein